MKQAKYNFLTIAFIFISVGVSAQIISVPKVVEKKVTNKINKVIDRKAGQVVDSVFKPVETPNQQNNKNISPSAVNKDTVPLSGNQPGLEAYSKYDFVPGEKVILFDDFSQDAVGDFPALWTANAPGEINTLNIALGKWFNFNNTEGNYFLLKRIDFPKNFIIEFDIVPKKTGGRIAAGLILYNESKPIEMDNNPHPGTNGLIISIEKANWNTLGYKTSESALITGSSTLNPVEQEKVNHVIIWVQNRRWRIYHKMAKVLDMPTQIYDGTKFNRLCFRLSRGASCGSYISNLRITDASPDMRSKLITEGKMVSYGIYFDVNKDQVKSESYGTLKGIADVLAENASVKIKIVGHTDADGSDAANLDLSKRRAMAVKNELVKTFGIDAARIETDGKGEVQPIAPNDTPSNKALNRRVEFLKL
ncbi:MAG: OmpA family protein [Chitinophagaceae bacterium]|nr:OmpA family protein [Chitinophagaceae bacterium]